MISVSKETAFDWLWGITGINLALGTLLWVVNSVALGIGFDYSSDAANSLIWQGIGGGMWGFGVLVFVITLATSAVVGAIEGGSGQTKAGSSNGESKKKWIQE